MSVDQERWYLSGRVARDCSITSMNFFALNLSWKCRAIKLVLFLE